jgi:hypothetical protein
MVSSVWNKCKRITETHEDYDDPVIVFKSSKSPLEMSFLVILFQVSWILLHNRKYSHETTHCVTVLLHLQY